jgi:hypothetical protein
MPLPEEVELLNLVSQILFSVVARAVKDTQVTLQDLIKSMVQEEVVVREPTTASGLLEQMQELVGFALVEMH